MASLTLEEQESYEAFLDRYDEVDDEAALRTWRLEYERQQESEARARASRNAIVAAEANRRALMLRCDSEPGDIGAWAREDECLSSITDVLRVVLAGINGLERRVRELEQGGGRS